MVNEYILLVSSSYILHAIACLERKGISTDKYCSENNINSAHLKNYHAFVPMQQVKSFYTSIIMGENLPELGLILGREYTITSHGMAGVAAISQENIFDFIKVCTDLLSLRFPAIKATIIEDEDEFGVRLEEVFPLGLGVPFVIEMSFLVICEMHRLLFPGDEDKLHFRFNFKAPAYSDLYAGYFGENVTFCSEYCEIRIENNRKYKRLSHHDPINSQMFFEKFMSDMPQVNKNNIYERMLKMIRLPSGKFMGQEEMSAMFSLSPRSFRRKLQESGSTFQDIINIEKRKCAIYYLIHTTMKITDISASLYFSDSSHFTKAFKSWVGISPSEYRSENQRSLVSMESANSTLV
mgnify:CR=1 FL=1